MKNVSVITLFVASLFVFQSCRVKLEPIVLLTFKEKIEKLFPNAVVTKLDKYDEFSRVYKLEINQLLNYKSKEDGTFKQIVYLSHVDEEMPMILIAEAESSNLETHELSALVRGNQIQIEDRFNSKSISTEYKKRTLATEDVHSIITKLKRLYTAKWISTGSEIGAEITLSHAYKYPWDVAATVVYNPNLSAISPEVLDFLQNKGKKIMYLYKEDNKSIPVLKPHVDAFKMVVENSSSSFLIKNLTKTKIEEIYKKLQSWLGYSVTLFPLN